MKFDYMIVWDNLSIYLYGVLETLKLLSISLFFGLVIAIPLGLMRVSKNTILSRIAWIYTYIIRGTPLLVQLYLVYYGLAQFNSIRESFLWHLLSSATFCACFALSINSSAYTAEIIASAIKNTSYKEIEAARSFGMSRRTMYIRLFLPSAIRRSIPQYSNEVVMMLHATSQASVVTLIDITGAARTINARYYAPLEAYVTAGFLYLLLTFILVYVFQRVESRWLAYTKRSNRL